MTLQLEQRLVGGGGWREARERNDLDTDPTVAFRIQCALLAHKARIHSSAVLQANKTSNLHSLAVQMRPVLECAGQVVLIVHPVMTIRKRGSTALLDYANAIAYDYLRRATKGQIGHKEALEIISEVEESAAANVGASRPKKRKGRSLRQEDKIAMLAGGKKWYSYLSQRFRHGGADWRGRTWDGGVISNNTVQDMVTFAVLMDYLSEQVAVMNAYTALCRVAGDDGKDWIKATLALHREVRETAKAVRDAAVATFPNVRNAAEH
ncbi:MAG: hypothetical protein OXH49_00805 [Gemmatimonadetes bacterium]|nr:hypothetical protein [Gemmatimonadota bacterium]